MPEIPPSPRKGRFDVLLQRVPQQSSSSVTESSTDSVIRTSLRRMTDSSPPNDLGRLQALMTGQQGLLYVCEPRVDRPIVHASEGSLELTGYCAKELEGRVSLSTLVHPADRERVDQEVKRFVTDNYSRAQAILTEHKQYLLDMADALLACEKLDAEQVKRICAGLPIDEPVASGPPETTPTREAKPAKERPSTSIVPPLAPPRPATQE